jgi:hypothetical protein
MRRLFIALLAAAAAGCGASSSGEGPAAIATPEATGTPEAGSLVAPPEPTLAARRARPQGRLAARLDAGEVAVVDMVGRIGIKPRELEFAKGGRLEAIEWSLWNDRRARGTGRMVGLVCDPTCAQGTHITVPATITLSRPVACPAGRFFGRSAIVAHSDDPEAESTSWLAAPC